MAAALVLVVLLAPDGRPPASAPNDPLAAESLRAVPVGRYDFESATPDDLTLAAEELSGLARVRDDEYLAVSDAHAVAHRMTIRIDPRTGAVRSATIGSPIPLGNESGARLPEPANAKDREAIVCDPDSGELWIADERDGADPKRPSISRHRLANGARNARLTCDRDSMLLVFGRIRSNKGFESLALAPDRATLWTANEDALTIDGAAAGRSTPGIVRLQQLDRALRPLAQFAYAVDPWRDPIRSPLLSGQEVSGLSELVALPGRRFLALERSLCGNARGMPTLENRLYLVDVSRATDIGSFSSGLAGRSYSAASKVLLWRSVWGLTNSNFEGMALGPILADGSRSLILIADNDGGTTQALFTLRLVAP